MPQSVTLSISAGVEKGPTVTGNAKFDIATYGASVEETVCKCTTKGLYLPPFKTDDIEFILVTADKFTTDQTCPPTANGSTPPRQCVSFWFEYDKNCKDGSAISSHRLLQYPTIVSSKNLPTTDSLGSISVKNDLTVDIKVSVLVIRKCDMCPKCPPDTNTPKQ